nr:23S rRNA (uracil(1939)-C(5))-methyltransferase RlmD [Desulfuromonadales bacterium]NIR33771.1 23S rRNA (uracil(1939)-C(5))-methyltransferase RlmD [Desulfuromonadales bacterium]NIS42455.1 23S rRNA (uracil(1939)-C(5))-methyltransferase RlmD [Desulfuromonadales bacterium]
HDGFVIGFYRRGSHFVVDVEQCPVASAGVNRILTLLRRELPRLCEPHRIPQVDVSEGDDGALRIVVHYIGRKRERIADELAALAQETGAAVFMQSGRKATLRRIAGDEDLVVIPRLNPQTTLRYGPGGFAQVNLAQNRALVEAVTEAASLTGKERLLDLFCGMGNFSLPLAARARRVVGIEDYPSSIASARSNARENTVDNADFHARPAEGALAEFSAEEPFDTVVLDPPRSGAYAVAREIAEVKPQQVIYISCDPPTLGRDINLLLHNGYRLVHSQAFDLFPQTHHIESVSLLKKISE